MLGPYYRFRNLKLEMEKACRRHKSFLFGHWWFELLFCWEEGSIFFFFFLFLLFVSFSFFSFEVFFSFVVCSFWFCFCSPLFVVRSEEISFSFLALFLVGLLLGEKNKYHPQPTKRDLQTHRTKKNKIKTKIYL